MQAIRLITLCFALSLFGLAFAQAWTIQTVAFRDFREASLVKEELQNLGFDAYTEFVMSRGKQFNRVRIGCFADKDGAENLANSLAGNVTKEAVVLPMTPGADVNFCVGRDLGFLLPQAWGVLSADGQAIVFWVEVAGKRAYINYDGSTWELTQEEPEIVAALSGGLNQTDVFASSSLSAQDVARASSSPLKTSFVPMSQYPKLIQALTAEQAIVVSSGELLWQSGRSAVLRSGNAVFALTLIAQIP